MFYHPFRLRLLVGVLLTLCALLSTSSVMAAEPNDEAAAAALYKSATQKVEVALETSTLVPEECLTDYSKIAAQYPDTETAKWAKMRYACCLTYLKRYDEAVKACQDVIAAYPGTAIAAWSQFYQGEALEYLKNYPEAARAYFKVEAYSNLDDQNPLVNARHCAGRTFLAIEMKDGFDAGLATFGISRTDDKGFAWVLLIRAVSRASSSDFGFAELHLGELKKDYAKCNDYIVAAEAEIGMLMLDYCDRDPKNPEAASYESKGVSLLNAVRQSVGLNNYVGSKTALRLAEYLMDTKHDLPAAEVILKEIQAKAPNCLMAKAGKYRLAQCLHSEKKYAEAAGVFGSIRQSDPLSGWAETAGFMQGVCLAAAGDMAKAKQVLDSVVKSDSTTQVWKASAIKRLASLYAETGENDKAVALLRDGLTTLQQRMDNCKDAAEMAKLTKAADTISKQIEKLNSKSGGTK